MKLGGMERVAEESRKNSFGASKFNRAALRGALSYGMATLETKGAVMHAHAHYYDLLAWLLTLGREDALRARMLDLARLAPGETVLDVGCGTGTLAIAAKRRVGASGTVHGIDAAPEMIEQARAKAAKAGADVRFQPAVVEALPLPDASVDVVLSTLMLHHLPRAAREQCAREIRRVLKPGGRVLAVDFAIPQRERKGLLARMHRHGHMKLADIVALLEGTGLRVAALGSVGVADLQFALAESPRPGDPAPAGQRAPESRALAPLPLPRWVFALVILAVIGAHGVVLAGVWGKLALGVVGVAALAGFLAITHSGVIGAVHAMLRGRARR